MEHFELVEKLVNTFGVSYEKAKEALEASNWDAIDAAIYLEREKKGETHQTVNEAPQENAESETADNVADEEPQPNVNTGTKGSYTYTIPVEDWKRGSTKFFNTIWDFLSKNSFVVKKINGEVFLDIPIWLMTLLICAFFWPVVIIMVIVFIMGYRFSFSGPHLGKKGVKNTMDQVETMTEEFVEKVKNTVAQDNVEPVESQPEIKIENDNEEVKAENDEVKSEDNTDQAE